MQYTYISSSDYYMNTMKSLNIQNCLQNQQTSRCEGLHIYEDLSVNMWDGDLTVFEGQQHTAASKPA